MAVLLYVLVSRVMYLGESATWIEDRRRRRDEAEKEVATTVGQRTVDDVPAALKAWPVDDDGGFVPPRRGQGEDSAVTEPVISPTMSSLTTRSKFILRRRRRIVKTYLKGPAGVERFPRWAYRLRRCSSSDIMGFDCSGQAQHG